MKEIAKTLTHQHLLILLAFYSVCALIAAYISQFIFDLQPCVLCLYQRVPFFVVTIIAVIAALLLKSEKSKKIVLFTCLGALLINVGIASYHVGVEKKIFEGPSGCSGSNLDEINNLEELKVAIKAAKAVRCDKPSFIYLGLSMAAWNVIYCLFLIGTTFIILPRNAREYPDLKRLMNRH